MSALASADVRRAHIQRALRKRGNGRRRACRPAGLRPEDCARHGPHNELSARGIARTRVVLSHG